MLEIVVVTGASGGIGGAVARKVRELAHEDMHIALHCGKNRGSADALAQELGQSFVVQADLSTAAGRRDLLEKTLEKGRPVALVNNAGIDKPHEPALMIEESSFDKLVAINLKAPVFLMRDFAREMSREGGVIVNVSSVLARMTLVGSALYRATKSALEELTRQFAQELGPRGVRVNAVAPGFIETAMTEGISPETRDKVRSQIALGEFGSADAVAAAVCHLIENDYLNGVVLPVDGGMRL